MNLPELFGKFLAIEHKNNLFEDYSDEGIPLWFLIRFPVWSSIILVEKLNLTQAWSSWSSLKRADLKSQIRRGYGVLNGTITHSPFIRLRECDLIFIGIEQKEKIAGYYYDIYMDYLIQELSEYRCLSLIPTGGQHHRPLATENYRYLDAINLSIIMKSLLVRRNEKIMKQIREILKVFEEELKLECDIDKESERLYYDKVFNFCEYKKAFEKILLRVKPKVILENNHYGVKNLAINVIAHEMRIPTVELQHGVINEYHVGYNYTNLEKGKIYPPLPSHIFLFSEYWRKACRLAIPEENKIVTGFPHFEVQKKKLGGVQRNHKQILFLSQGLIGRQLADIAYDLAKRISGEYKIVYKLHPAEHSGWREKYPQLIGLPNVEVPGQYGDKSLYHLFAQSKFQVGVFSTSIYEGLGFDLITFIVNLPGSEYMTDLIDSKFAAMINSADDILMRLDKHGDEFEEFGDKLWQKNAIINMKSAIECISREFTASSSRASESTGSNRQLGPNDLGAS